MKNKIAFLSVLLLVSTMMLGSLPGDAEARTEYDSILRIATQAHKEIKIQLDRSDSVPANVERMFQEGTSELNALKEAIRNEDPEAAKRHFLSAMNIFKQISHMVSDRPATEAAMTDTASVRPELKSALERTEKYLINLKNIARTHGTDVDFSQLDELLNLAKQQIREDNYADAQNSIKEINRLIIDIKSKLREASQEKASDRAKQFAQAYLDRLDKMITEAEELGYPIDIIEKLKAAKEKLSESSDPRQIIEEIKRILSIRDQLDLSKFDRIISRADQIEEKINELSNMNEIDSAQIEDARMMLSDLRSSVDERNYDIAQSLLRTLTDMLKTMQNSVN